MQIRIETAKDIEQLSQMLRQAVLAGNAPVITFEAKTPRQRTTKQNASLHKYYTLLAQALNAAGLDMVKVLKEGTCIPWTETSVKSHLWRPIQVAMLECLLGLPRSR